MVLDHGARLVDLLLLLCEGSYELDAATRRRRDIVRVSLHAIEQARPPGQPNAATGTTPRRGRRPASTPSSRRADVASTAMAIAGRCEGTRGEAGRGRVLLRSCDSWTNTCLTAWNRGVSRRGRSTKSAAHSHSLQRQRPRGGQRPHGEGRRRRRRDGVGGPRRATGVASRSPAAVGPCRPRTRGAVRGHAVDHDADFKPFFAMI